MSSRVGGVEAGSDDRYTALMGCGNFKKVN